MIRWLASAKCSCFSASSLNSVPSTNTVPSTDTSPSIFTVVIGFLLYQFYHLFVEGLLHSIRHLSSLFTPLADPVQMFIFFRRIGSNCRNSRWEGIRCYIGRQFFHHKTVIHWQQLWQ